MKLYIGGYPIELGEQESKPLNDSFDLDKLFGTSTGRFDFYNIYGGNGVPKNCPTDYCDLLVKKYNYESDLQIVLSGDGIWFRYNNHSKHRDFKKVI